MLNDIVEENEGVSVSMQVTSYLTKPMIPRHESAIMYWAANQSHLPVLVQVVGI